MLYQEYIENIKIIKNPQKSTKIYKNELTFLDVFV